MKSDQAFGKQDTDGRRASGQARAAQPSLHVLFSHREIIAGQHPVRGECVPVRMRHEMPALPPLWRFRAIHGGSVVGIGIGFFQRRATETAVLVSKTTGLATVGTFSCWLIHPSSRRAIDARHLGRTCIDIFQRRATGTAVLVSRTTGLPTVGAISCWLIHPRSRRAIDARHSLGDEFQTCERGTAEPAVPVSRGPGLFTVWTYVFFSLHGWYSS